MKLNTYGNFVSSSACHSERREESLDCPGAGRKESEMFRFAQHDRSKKRRRLLLIGIFLFAGALAVPTTQAHDARPAYLEVKEIAPNQFSILWRRPVLAGMRLP